MNWYPTTGRINFQGAPAAAAALEAEIAQRLMQPGMDPAAQEPSTSVEQVEPATDADPQQPIPQTAERCSDDSELVIGLVSAIGTDLEQVITLLDQRLSLFSYQSEVIKISRDIIAALRPSSVNCTYYETVNQLMDGGNQLRQGAGDHSILALAAAACRDGGDSRVRPNGHQHSGWGALLHDFSLS